MDKPVRWATSSGFNKSFNLAFVMGLQVPESKSNRLLL